ncbi:MAG: hypothetical protein R3268_14430 [Acidiferrobacterales bacterium]|nr:hypothetical protein [Acidiferrobacterales bacterium]
MATRDLKSNLLAAQSLAPAAVTASANGTGVDLRGFDSAQVIIDAGAWTDGTHTFEVQESDDDATYTAVADTELDGTEPVIDGAADDDQVYTIGYKGGSRYLRVAVTVSGATSGAVYGAMIQRGHPHRAPTA